jgi:hypothetical protein
MTTATTTIHLNISDVDQETPTTRRTPTTRTPTPLWGLLMLADADSEIAFDLEQVAARRRQNPGELVDATTVLPELAE